MITININESYNTGKLFTAFITAAQGEDKEVRLLVSSASLDVYNALSLRDIIRTYQGVLNLTAICITPPNLNVIAALSVLPPASRMISPSNLIIFVRERWFTNGTVNDANIINDEKGKLDSVILSHISANSKLTEELMREYIRDGKIMEAAEAIECGLFGGMGI